MPRRLKFLLAAGASVLAICAASPADAMPFNYTGAIVDYMIPTTGVYTITARGAQGGVGQGSEVLYAGGRGAQVSGEFLLTAGTLLHIAVGGAGQSGYGDGFGGNGGGGGGSFVVQDVAQPLVVAGGGGGIRANARRNGFDANTGRAGFTGSSSYANGTGGGLSNGKDGQGGAAPYLTSSSWGSNGGGFLTDGANDCAGTGGRSWANGLAGGTSNPNYGGDGGFGGGGSGAGCLGGGGGGGWSGGDGGWIAGGGGSYLRDGAGNPLFLAGLGYGNGYVSINLTGEAVPEPASLGLFGLSLAGLGLLRRRGRR